ncbi:hypothetical protein CPT_Pipo_001 [Acinetobacter phage Pipo]|uniref:Uncharacterized protein n=1 Tax=Acinetobacter phage Pipo TaxID=2797425 RepID=A0A7T8EUC5_9CAUD|nr:hypothetical protein CPT_Pipo_001 [Acinetobacter phage Pipo]
MLGRSLENHLSTTLISYLRKVLGSFSERLYWFGSLPLCRSSASMHFFIYSFYTFLSITSYYSSYHYSYIYILITFLYSSYLYVLISTYIDSSIFIFLY